MTPRQWQAYLPLEVDLDCSGQRHRVRWENGGLIAVNHSDARGERTLAALARQHVPCLDLMQLWEQHADDVRVLALASRGAGDPLGSISSQSPGQPTFGGGLGQDPLVQLLTQAGPLTDRLVANVAAAWVERLEAGHHDSAKHAPALQAALYGRVLASVRTWLNAPRMQVHVEMLAEDELPSATRDEAGMHVRVPLSWIVQVWARGLAILLGHLVLRVEDTTEQGLKLLAVSPDLSETVAVTITVG